MKRNLKKLLAIICAAALMLGLFGCGAKNEAPAQAEVPQNKEEPVVKEEPSATSEGSSEPLKVMTWSNAGTVDALTQISEQFTEETGIEVELIVVSSSDYATEFNNRMSIGDVDVFSYSGNNIFGGAQVDWAESEKPNWQILVDGGKALDLSGYDWINNWSTGASVCEYNGGIYGIATGAVAHTGLFYNKQMFADNGWKVPETWDEFVTLCENIKATGVAPMTCGGGDTWPYTMLPSSVIATVDEDVESWIKGLWTGERTYTDEKSLLVYERLDVYNSYMETGFMGISYAEAPGRFVTGKAAMMPDGTWQVATIKQADPEFEFGYFPLPGTEKGTGLQGKFDVTLGIAAESKKIDDAAKWMEVFSRPENYAVYCEKTGFIPTMDIETDDPFLAELIAGSQGMAKAYDTINRIPTTAGQYLQKTGYCGQYLKSAGGPVETAAELAALTQADWDAAMEALGK